MRIELEFEKMDDWGKKKDALLYKQCTLITLQIITVSGKIIT